MYNITNLNESENKLPKLLTPAELKEYLHIGNNKLYELLKRKDFPSFKIGNRFYVIEKDLHDWLDAQCKKSSFVTYRTERDK